ncbi:MAG: transglutaminase family protein [Rhodobacterales bacterium]|nr:transglutaminase family protein [Rhodobacterales bacterium]NCT12760.1 transglutaminase family protein [Rhodobacterales bacterium]
MNSPLRLRISHVTSYDYDRAVPYGLQQLRLTPKSHASQTVLSWVTTVDGGHKELSFEDAHRNTVDLISFDPGTTRVTLRCEGEVEMTDNHGIIGAHGGFMPLWMFDRVTPLTRAGSACRKLIQALPDSDTPLDRLHALTQAIRDTVAYEAGRSDITWGAEDVLTAGHGVCQDHAHVFIACARAMGVPARYVSGYLFMEDRVQQEATHAWAEAHVTGLGWVGFDVSNGISPDWRYVRVATGLDYGDAAPITGTRFGSATETMAVAVEVEVQQQ